MEMVSLRVDGVVQDVLYRDTARRTAQDLGLTGWVRNTMDGGVEALAEGETEKIDQFLEWCREGPPSATVSKVDIQARKRIDSRTFTIFKILPTV